MNNKNIIKVGVGIMILKGGKVLLGKRKGSHGSGEFAFPGGHLEFGESIKACAKRETAEEAGIKISNIRFLMFKNITEYAGVGRHYAHISVVADIKSGNPKNLEPEKTESWGWYDLDDLPKPLFVTITETIEAYKTGKNFYDSTSSKS